jgi:DNA-binding NarL/FixJ family response regulator
MAIARILLGDDHYLVIEGLKRVLSQDFEVIGAACDGRELVALSETLKPHAVLLDISMPLLNGIEAGRRIKAARPETKLVYVTQFSEKAYVQTALQVGALGYILKESVVREVVEGLKEVLAGRRYISPILRNKLPDELWQRRQEPTGLFGESLTARQREVLQLVAEGKSNKEIAALLDVSIKTIDYHKASLSERLGLHTTAELTRYAIENAIVRRPPAAAAGAP